RHTSFSSPPFSLTPPPPPRSPLFPYTTLFRSSATWSARTTPRSSASKTSYPLPKGNSRAFHAPPGSCHAIPAPHLPFSNLEPSRSEEHTSELQSRFDLVCRLLLEKKKQTPLNH